VWVTFCIVLIALFSAYFISVRSTNPSAIRSETIQICIRGYLPSDVNGEGITDLVHAEFADNNGFNFAGKITPKEQLLITNVKLKSAKSKYAILKQQFKIWSKDKLIK